MNTDRQRSIEYVSRCMMEMYHRYCFLLEKGLPYNKKINYTVKRTEDKSGNDGQYGYYINYNACELDALIKKYNIDTILDLGIGAGVLFGVLKAFNPNVVFAGYDIENSLLDYCIQVFDKIDVKNKDIITLTSEDIKYYKALYFWEPLADRELAKKFVDNLEKIVVSGQYIFYKTSGYIMEFLKDCKNLERLEDKGIIVFKVK